jgi:hypothetical protein
MAVSAKRVPVRASLGFWLGAIVVLCSGLAAAAESDAHALARGNAEPAQTQAATPVTVDFGGLGTAVRVYDPLKGAAPVKSVTAGEAVAVSLTDHPLVIEVGPLPAAAPGRKH